FAQRINGSVEPRLQPMVEIHFDNDLQGDQPNGNKAYMYAFASVGFFIILLACINYMNMATARSVTRIGEMGIRKVLGYSRTALFRQVMMEALVLTIVAMLIATVMAFVILEWTPFNAVIGKELSLDFLNNPYLAPGILGITLMIGMLSGLYPAIYIPAVPVVKALKGTFTGDRASSLLRKVLIVFQFVVSLFVIICTVIMEHQIAYMQDKDVGFDNENVLLINIRDTTVSNQLEVVKELLLANPNIEQAANSYGTPGVGIGGSVMKVERDSSMAQQSMDIIWAGQDFLETMGIEIIEGRDFHKDSEADLGHSFLVNETGVKELGWSDQPLGKRARYFHGEEDMRVIGVMRDFNFESLHEPIRPLFIIPNDDGGGVLHLRVNSQDFPKTLTFIEETWTRFDRRYPFEHYFLDEEYAREYEEDQRQQRLIGGLSYVCIFVSILGLIGLSAFTVGRRSKEISIRKVLGAQVGSIIFLFSKDYLRLIVIAFAISIPLAYYIIVEWLRDFAYRVDVRWDDFAVPGVLVLLLGLITVSIQLVRSARANPVDGLRSE
ncbi:MAG: FtsX-like permease family protein, partial [Bacteroidota bacterium]